MIQDFTLQWQVETLQSAYADAIDEGRLDDWPVFFTDPCEYKLISKANYDRGLPMALVFCDSQGMLRDRVYAYGKLNVYAPRSWRHLLGRASIKAVEGGVITAEANFAVVETLLNETSHILCAGRSFDTIVRDGDALRFRQRHCVYDNALIPGSVVFPV